LIKRFLNRLVISKHKKASVRRKIARFIVIESDARKLETI
jgi:hypothetical protein